MSLFRNRQRNSNSAYANYGGPQANPENTEEELAFIGKRRELGGAVTPKEWERAQSPKYEGFSLVGLVGREKFSSSCWIVAGGTFCGRCR